jgi:hypothetical protein
MTTRTAGSSPVRLGNTRRADALRRLPVGQYARQRAALEILPDHALWELRDAQTRERRARGDPGAGCARGLASADG